MILLPDTTFLPIAFEAVAADCNQYAREDNSHMRTVYH
jgi:hypothetical protein